MMHTLEIDPLGPSLEEDRLNRLHYWLTLEGMTAPAAGMEFFLPYGFILMAVVLAAVVFAPYLLWHLVQARRFGWIGALVLMIGLPGLAGYLLGLEFVFIPLAAFYVYCWVLRYAVARWIDNLRSARLVEEARHARDRGVLEREAIRFLSGGRPI